MYGLQTLTPFVPTRLTGTLNWGQANLPRPIEVLLLKGAFLSFSKAETPRVFNIFTNGFRTLEEGSRLLKTLGADFLLFFFGKIW